MSKKNTLRQGFLYSGTDDSVQDHQEPMKTVEQRQKGWTPPIKVHVEVDITIPQVSVNIDDILIAPET